MRSLYTCMRMPIRLVRLSPCACYMNFIICMLHVFLFFVMFGFRKYGGRIRMRQGNIPALAYHYTSALCAKHLPYDRGQGIVCCGIFLVVIALVLKASRYEDQRFSSDEVV